MLALKQCPIMMTGCQEDCGTGIKGLKILSQFDEHTQGLIKEASMETQPLFYMTQPRQHDMVGFRMGSKRVIYLLIYTIQNPCPKQQCKV